MDRDDDAGGGRLAVEDLDRYLELLVGDVTEGFIEIRWRHPGQAMRRAFVPLQRSADAVRRILDLAARADVYLGCAPRTRREGGLDAVATVSWLWADLDNEAAVSALASFNPKPTLMIASGSGRNRHVYWSLTEPIPPGEAGRGMRRLQLRLGSDPAATHAAQILRPPGTLNYKHDPPKPVSVVTHSERCVDLTELLGDAPALPLEANRGRVLGSTLADSADPLRRILPAHYIEVLTGQQPNALGKVACPFHSDSDPSLHVYDTPEGGWYCFGCRRGTDIYVLAGELWRLRTRGADFIELRRRLEDEFLSSSRTPKASGQPSRRVA